jgi:hypothetical protein
MASVDDYRLAPTDTQLDPWGWKATKASTRGIQKLGKSARYRAQFEGLLRGQGEDVYRDLMPELGAYGKKLTQGEIQKFLLRKDQYLRGRQQAGQSRQVDAMINDPGRLWARDQRMQKERTQSLSDLADRYTVGQRYNAFNQARRGTQGGSSDVEAQGGLRRARDRGALGIQSNMDSKAQQYRLGDQQQRSALMGMIYGDDPNMASAFSRTIEGIGAQQQMASENLAMQQQNTARQNATDAGYSQAIGGALTSGSQPLSYDIEHGGGGGA